MITILHLLMSLALSFHPQIIHTTRPAGNHHMALPNSADSQDIPAAEVSNPNYTDAVII